MLMPTEDPPKSTIHTECGAESKRTLTIADGSVRLSLADGKSIELQGWTWEYGFSSDTPLVLCFESLGSFSCTVNYERVATDGAGPHWSCKRPSGDDETYDLRFRFDGAASPGLLPSRNKPSAAQPTLIIRTKRNCPTGVVTKPTVDE